MNYGVRRTPLRVGPGRPAAGAGLIWIAAASAILIWSGTPIAIKIAIADIDPMTAGVLRSMLAGLIAIVVVTLSRLRLPSGLRARALLVIAGTTSFAVWPILLSFGLGFTTASHAALIMAIIPVFTGLIAHAFERRWPRARWWFAAVVALTGSTLLITQRHGGFALDPAGIVGDLIIVAGAATCALGYVTGARVTPLIGAPATTVWGLACASIILVPVFALLAPHTEWADVSASGWGGIVYLTLMSSVLGYGLWYWALSQGGAARVSSLQFGMPVPSLIMAAVVLGEAVTATLVGAGAIILAGTWLAQRHAA